MLHKRCAKVTWDDIIHKIEKIVKKVVRERRICFSLRSLGSKGHDAPTYVLFARPMVSPANSTENIMRFLQKLA